MLPGMLPRDQRRKLVQEIWRRAPSQPLPLRLKNIQRAELLVKLWQGFDRHYAEAAGIGDATGSSR
jgi:hypothetical protein